MHGSLKEKHILDPRFPSTLVNSPERAARRLPVPLGDRRAPAVLHRPRRHRAGVGLRAIPSLSFSRRANCFACSILTSRKNRSNSFRAYALRSRSDGPRSTVGALFYSPSRVPATLTAVRLQLKDVKVVKHTL
jgi:hypothetical protein